MKLIILSAPTTNELTKKAEDYEIHQLGSLTITNGYYFLAILGEHKVPTVVEPEEHKVTAKSPAKSKPK